MTDGPRSAGTSGNGGKQNGKNRTAGTQYIVAVQATHCGGNGDVHPVSAMVTYEFPTRGPLPPVKLTWWEGLRAPWPAGLDEGLEMPPEGGIIFNGSKGKIMAGVYANRPVLLPAQLDRDYQRPVKTIPRIEGEGHEMEWVRACKARKQGVSSFDYAARLTEICLLGNLAKRMDVPLTWDGAAMKFTNVAEANAFVAPEYRSGWSLQ